MENQESVDQLPVPVRRFIDEHHDALGRRGAIVVTWRRRGAQRFGPYFRLTLRDPGGRQRSVYLGMAGALVDQVRGELGRMQAAHRERRQLARIRRQLRGALADARRQFDLDLASVGLHLQGNEIRGWNSLAPPSAKHRHDPGQPQPWAVATKAIRP